MSKWIIGGEEQIFGDGNPVIKHIDLDQEVVIVDGERLTKLEQSRSPKRSRKRFISTTE